MHNRRKADRKYIDPVDVQLSNRVWKYKREENDGQFTGFPSKQKNEALPCSLEKPSLDLLT